MMTKRAILSAVMIITNAPDDNGDKITVSVSNVANLCPYGDGNNHNDINGNDKNIT